MKILVTGGAGFIGSHIVERLVEDGHDVRVFDNLSTGHMENLEGSIDRVDFLKRDIRDLASITEAAWGCDVIFHEAALCSVSRSVANPRDTNAVNVEGTLNVLLAARDSGVKRVVCASSSSVCGNEPTLPKKETQAPCPASPYAVSKLAGELYCRTFFHLFGLETFSLRYFNVFGPRQDPNSPYAAVIPSFVNALLHGKAPVIEGDGLQSRDFTYVDNVVAANLGAMNAHSGFGEAFNVACGQMTTVQQLAEHVTGLLGMAIEPLHVRPRPGDVRHSFADISKAQSVLSYHPQVDLLAGLRHTVEWYRERYGPAPEVNGSSLKVSYR